MKSTLYLKAKVLPGNKIEIETPNLVVGQTVEVVILVSENTPDSGENQSLSLEQRLAFLKLPMAERRRILESQAETMISHYEEDSEWKELMSGDIVDY
ncbi:MULTISPECIES: hypothetical protein [Sphaerospermopsis]|uniref:Uncharacterized protein n=1 Tax=Sphaerospermopsis torques-reginae ITEP-024 TaxID=984208 RepID=A0ABX8WXC5_9CYAN|nr:MULTISPECIES: hypothetical protein [Sphaerospermopsis]MBE9054467.1 hypothetical protein [Sphaerospermopsis sp. LEGE 08334]QYX31034.1 hypothetical protein K2F26_19600 [Sphaerospermopsis torques-reginae ITEP-024]